MRGWSHTAFLRGSSARGHSASVVAISSYVLPDHADGGLRQSSVPDDKRRHDSLRRHPLWFASGFAQALHGPRPYCICTDDFASLGRRDLCQGQPRLAPWHRRFLPSLSVMCAGITWLPFAAWWWPFVF